LGAALALSVELFAEDWRPPFQKKEETLIKKRDLATPSKNSPAPHVSQNTSEENAGLSAPTILPPTTLTVGFALGAGILPGLNSIALSWDQFLRGTEPHNFLASMDGRRTLGR